MGSITRDRGAFGCCAARGRNHIRLFPATGEAEKRCWSSRLASWACSRALLGCCAPARRQVVNVRLNILRIVEVNFPTLCVCGDQRLNGSGSFGGRPRRRRAGSSGTGFRADGRLRRWSGKRLDWHAPAAGMTNLQSGPRSRDAATCRAAPLLRHCRRTPHPIRRSCD